MEKGPSTLSMLGVLRSTWQSGVPAVLNRRRKGVSVASVTYTCDVRRLRGAALNGCGYPVAVSDSLPRRLRTNS